MLPKKRACQRGFVSHFSRWNKEKFYANSAGIHHSHFQLKAASFELYAAYFTLHTNGPFPYEVRDAFADGVVFIFGICPRLSSVFMMMRMIVAKGSLPQTKIAV